MVQMTTLHCLFLAKLDIRLQTSWQNLTQICEISTNDVALLRQEFGQISTRLNDMSGTVSGMICYPVSLAMCEGLCNYNIDSTICNRTYPGHTHVPKKTHLNRHYTVIPLYFFLTKLLVCNTAFS